MNGKIKKIKCADIAVAAVILAAAAVISALSYFSPDGGVKASIICGRETLYEIDLGSVKQEYVISLDNGVKIKVAENAIGFIESDCPGKDCIKCGMLSRAGSAAVCVPNETVIKLSGYDKKQPDAISY